MWPFSHAKLKMLGNEMRETTVCVCSVFHFAPLRTSQGSHFHGSKNSCSSAQRLASDIFAPNTPVIGAAASPMGKETVGKGHLNKSAPKQLCVKRTVRSQNRTQFNKTASLSPLFFYGCGEHKIQHRDETPLPKNLAQTPGGMKFWIYDNLCREQISFTAENDCLFNEHTHQVQPFRMLQREFPTHMRLLRDLIYDPRLATILGKSRRRFISNEKSEWLFPGGGVG
jgi:hypothetical protein